MKSISASPTPAETGRRLGFLLVGYLAAVVGVITLAPFHFAVPDAVRVVGVLLDQGWVADIVLNIVLFIPLGLIWHRTTGRSVLAVASLAALLSVLIETAQLFLVPRYTTVSDVVANVTGAAAGAYLSAQVSRRFGTGRAAAGRLLLDLPLTGLVYVMLPLLWLVGLSAEGAPSRLWLLAPIATAGGLAIAAVARDAAVGSSRSVAPLLWGAAGWFAIGSVPALRIDPRAALAGLAVTLAAALAGRVLWDHAVRRDRRLEPQVVRVLLPFLLMHLVASSTGGEQASFFKDPDLARVTMMRWLEGVGAFTVLGYLIAEWRGRRHESALQAVILPIGAAIAVSIGVMLVRGAAPNVIAVSTSVVAGIIGALLYLRQRDHIIALYGRAPTLR